MMIDPLSNNRYMISLYNDEIVDDDYYSDY